eukprot:12035690-Alexandrium_andersonii.AAC.1
MRMAGVEATCKFLTLMGSKVSLPKCYTLGTHAGLRAKLKRAAVSITGTPLPLVPACVVLVRT